MGEKIRLLGDTNDDPKDKPRGDQKEPNDDPKGEPKYGETCCCTRGFVCYVATATNLPWEIVAYIAGISTNVKGNGTETDLKESKCFRRSEFIYTCLVATFALIGLIAQNIICFRRDRLDKSFLRMIPMGNNTSKFMECHEPSQMVSAIIIPDVILLWFLFLVLRKRICKHFVWYSNRESKNTKQGLHSQSSSINTGKSDTGHNLSGNKSTASDSKYSLSASAFPNYGATNQQNLSPSVHSGGDQRTNQSASDQRTSDQSTSDQRTRDQIISEQRTSDQSTSDQRTSNQRTSDQTTGDENASDQRTRDQSNSDQSLSDLVDKIKASGRKPDWCMKLFILAIPFYILCSKVVSIGNLFAFEIVDPYNGNEVMDWGESYITGSWKIVLIVLSFLGFVAFDLLYTEVIVRYALQCQLNIYFLEFIINNVQAYKSQNEALKDILKAQKFLKELNESSLTIGLVLLTSTLHTANCTVSLLSIAKNCTHLQILLLLARAIQWAFLTLFPIFQAAQISNTIKKLRETGLSMYAPPVEFETPASESEKQLIRKYTSGIALNVELFGFNINPWFPYVIVILIFFAIMLEPLGLKWFQHLI